jgi:hydrogenase maturation protease
MRMGGTGNRQLVLGLGNDIAGNDAIGLAVARDMVKRQPAAHPCEYDVELSSESYTAILSYLFEYDRIIIVDAAQVDDDAVGKVFVHGLEDAPANRSRLAHQCGLLSLVGKARRFSGRTGAQVAVVAIGVPTLPYVTLSETMDDVVLGALDEAVRCVMDLVRAKEPWQELCNIVDEKVARLGASLSY